MLDQIRQHASSWGVKIAFGIIIIVFVFWGVGSYTNTPPGTAATVNGKPILMQDFLSELHAEEEQFRRMAPDMSSEDLRSLHIAEQVLSRLVTRALLEQEAKRLGVTVTPVEYAAFVHRMPTFQVDGKFDQKRYEAYVASQGRNIAEFERGFMRDLLMEKMQEYITAAVSVTPEEARKRLSFEREQRTMSYVLFPTDDYKGGVTVTDEAVANYYGGNQAQFARPATLAVSYIDMSPEAIAHTMDVSDAEVEKVYATGPLRYNTRQVHLTLPEGTTEAAEAAIRAELEAVAGELRAGADFAEVTAPLAEKYPDARMGESGMMEAKRMPQELLGALAGLDKNEIAPLIKMEGVLVLVQLLETDPDWSLPEDAIKAQLRRELAEEKAALAFRDVQAQAEDLVAMSRPLADIAKEMKVEVKTTSPAPREELAYTLGLRKPGQVSLFEGDKGTLVHAILETREGFAVAEIADTQPAGIKPLDEVKDEIITLLIQREAEKKAEEAARAVVGEFANGVPAAYQAKLITSEPFFRQGNIPGIGYAKSLTDTIFASPLDAWLGEPFATPLGAVIAMPAEILPLKDDALEKIESRAMELILQAKKGQVMNAFIAELHKGAEVIVPDTSIFER